MAEKDMNMSQKKVFNRGVSAGYFNIDVEDVSVMNVEARNVYDLGLEYGKERLKTKQIKGELDDAYNAQREGYLEVLRAWENDGEIVFKEGVKTLDTTSLGHGVRVHR